MKTMIIMETVKLRNAFAKCAKCKTINVRLELSSKNLVVAATSPHMKMRVTVPSLGKNESGDFVCYVEGPRILGILNHIVEETTELIFQDDPCMVQIKSGGINIKQMCLCLEDVVYSPIKVEDSFKRVTVPAKTFQEFAKQTLHGILPEQEACEPRKSALYVELFSEGLRITSSSGISISVRDDSRGDFLDSLIIYGRSLVDACSIVSGESEDSNLELMVSNDGNYVVISDEKDGVLLSIQCIAGTFFNIAKMLSTFHPKIGLDANLTDLLSALKIIRCASNDKKVVCRVYKDRIMMSSADKCSVAEIKVPCIGTEFQREEPLTIGFNSNLLMDALASIKAETVHVSFQNETSLVYITAGHAHEYVLPMLIKL